MMASLVPTTPCAAVEIVLPMVMMELANQILEVDFAGTMDRLAVETPIVAVANAMALANQILEVGSAGMTDRVAVQTPIVAVANVEAVEIVSLTLEEGSARMRT